MGWRRNRRGRRRRRGGFGRDLLPHNQRYITTALAGDEGCAVDWEERFEMQRNGDGGLDGL